MRRFALPPVLGLALALLTGPGQADPPPADLQNSGVQNQPGSGLANLVPSSAPADAGVNPMYAVTPQAGLWMICVSSYQGPDAAELAQKLCEYLCDHRLQGYVYCRGSEERKQLQEELDRWQKEHPGLPRRKRVAHMGEEQYAVLLGGFRDIDAANAELKKVRKMDAPNIHLKSGKPALDTYDVYEQSQQGKGYELKRYAVNPFHTAFVIRNPTVPREQRPVAKFDPLWKKLNAEEPRSLYKCPKPWTLAVQEYVGTQVIMPANATGGFLEKLGFNDNNLGKRLDASAGMAQGLCDMLRELKFKSYVLHTRNSSVVTVGEFDSPTDPNLLRVQDQLSHFSFKDKQGHEAVKLFAKAQPMEVPR
jgi:hypothetical protein